jgi:hypothetical protein
MKGNTLPEELSGKGVQRTVGHTQAADRSGSTGISMIFVADCPSALRSKLQ